MFTRRILSPLLAFLAFCIPFAFSTSAYAAGFNTVVCSTTFADGYSGTAVYYYDTNGQLWNGPTTSFTCTQTGALGGATGEGFSFNTPNVWNQSFTWNWSLVKTYADGHNVTTTGNNNSNSAVPGTSIGTKAGTCSVPANCTTATDITHYALTITSGPYNGIEILDFSVSTPAPALCDVSKVAGSYSGTTLSVRIAGQSSVPAGGWRIDAPDPGWPLPGTRTMTITGTDNVEGQTGTYYKSVTLSSLSAYQGRISAINGSGVATCSAPFLISSNQISSTAPDTSGTSSGDAGDGSSCGFSLNPEHWVTCLFYPPSDVTSHWKGQITTLQTRTPINIMVGGFTWISSVYNLSNCQFGNDPGGCGSSGPGAYQFDAPTDSNSSDLVPQGSAARHMDMLSAAASEMQNHGSVIYAFEIAIFWMGWLWWAWARVSKSFGGKDEEG